jgi:hypothetical protein
MTTTTPSEIAPTSKMAEATADETDLVGMQAVPFESWSRLDDANAVRIYFGLSGYGRAHVTVHEDSKSVGVELWIGIKPDDVGKIEPHIAWEASLDVRLDQPLGDRQVLSVVDQ